MNDFYYRKLNVYHRSMLLVKSVYEVTKTFPAPELYALTDQLRRAVVSIPSNIAEGMGRFSNKERIHFLEFSNGSAMEVMCQLETSLLLGSITQQKFDELEHEISEITKMLVGLRKNFEDKQ